MKTIEEHAALAGLRVLMVEDEMMLAMSLEDLLELVECKVVKAPSVKKALALIDKEEIDGALLDVNLRGGRVYPVAEELAQRDIPFVFMTGYDETAIDKRWRDRPIVRKPFSLDALEHAAAPAFTAARQ
jgi:CheY-like chemotaxis protein